MARSITDRLTIPYRNQLLVEDGTLSRPWEAFFGLLVEAVLPFGIETTCPILNNQSSPLAIDGLSFNAEGISQVIVDFLIQRVTTSTGATELIESGTFFLVYRPTAEEWALVMMGTPGPDDSGVDFYVNQAAFASTYDHTTSTWTKSSHGLNNNQSVTLTAGTSLPTGYSLATTYYVINATSGTFKLSSTVGGSAVVATTDDGTGTQTVHTASSGQVKYISSNITGTASISKLSYRARTMASKSVVYSKVGR